MHEQELSCFSKTLAGALRNNVIASYTIVISTNLLMDDPRNPLS